MPIDIILVFWYWFYHLFAIVAWCGFRSTPFDIKSGVRQDSVASCWIFNMVIDGLVSRLEASGLGCYFQGIFAGCILHADDVMLISGSLRKLQLMLNIYFSFVNEFGLTFNAKTSNCLLIGKNFSFNLPIIYIGNKSINWANECCYLGVVIVAGRFSLLILR